MSNPKADLNEKCPRCGKAFHCSKSGRCWCLTEEVPPTILEQLARTYHSCLCPDCLKILSKGLD